MKILNGDCFNWLRGLDDNSIDVIFTSPPYNRKRNDKYQFYDDVIENYFKFLCDFTSQALRVTKKHVIINLQKNYYNKKDVFKFIGDFAPHIVEIIIWEKTNPMPANGYNITNSYEFFIVLGNTALKSNTTYTKNIISTSVNSDMPKEHKAVMKQEVSDWFIEHFTAENDLVADPFMGIGTTGISCKKFNREFIGVELKPIYCNMAEEKISSFGG